MTSEHESGRREFKKAVTRAAILDAARRLFRDHGVQQTSVQQVAEAAQTGVGTLYNYFPSKDALLNAVLLEDQRFWFAEYEARVTAVMSHIEGLLVALDMLWDYACESRELMIASFAVAAREPDVTRLPGASLVRAYSELLAEGIAAGGLSVSSVDGVARTLVTNYVMAALGIGPWRARGDDASLRGELHAITRRIVSP